MLNRFHPVYHSYTYLAGSRIDIERVLEPKLGNDDPEEVIDFFSEPPQFFERLSPVTTTIGERQVKGRNWTDMMIQCYRLFGRIFLRATAFLRQYLENDHHERTMVPFMSMAVDPDTLARLIEHDYEAGETSYSKLIELYETGAVAPTLTTPFHCILPLLPSSFDRRLCVRLGLVFFEPVLRAYERYLKGIDENQMAMGFWAPEAAMDRETVQIVCDEFQKFAQAHKFRKPHLVLLLDSPLASQQSLDKLMKSWCQLSVGKKPLKDTTVIFRDPGFSNWMMHSHPSIKKIIDRTIAKVDANLGDSGVDYTWAHFESIESLTYSPRDAVNYEQRILKLCELSYLSVSPDTFARRKLNGRFGVAPHEPLMVEMVDKRPDQDPMGEENTYGRWRGWAIEGDKPQVMPSKPFVRRSGKGNEKRQGSPCWKIAWTKTRDDCFKIVGGDPKTLKNGMLGVLAKLTGARSTDTARASVEEFLIEYAYIYWREHFIQHDMSEADIRIDDIVQRTLRKGSKKKTKVSEIVTAALAAQAYFFLLDSCNSYALDADNLDQRAMFQNVVMLTLAFSNAVAVYRYLDDKAGCEATTKALREYLFDFKSAYKRYNLQDYGVSQKAWDNAIESDVLDSDLNVVERAARRTAARQLEEFGFDDWLDPEDAELTTNVGHHWSGEINIPNYQWANHLLCGVREA